MRLPGTAAGATRVLARLERLARRGARWAGGRLRAALGRGREVADVRRRLRRAAREPASEPERREALAMRALRGEVLRALERLAPGPCARCGIGHEPPHGRWPGGFCCGASTADLFTDDELAALHLAGTRPADLRPPSGDHAGCAFRGARGCSLPPVHRPSVCVRHLCRELVVALARAGALDAVEARCVELEGARRRFVALRAGRHDDELLGLTSDRRR